MSPPGFILRELAAAVRDSTRLAAVRETGLLDSPRSQALDRLAQLGQRLLCAPTFLIFLADTERDYLVGGTGMDDRLNQIREIRGQPTFTQYAVATREAFGVENVSSHQMFSAFPNVFGTPVVSCATAPLLSTEGHALGSICAIDYTPRNWTEDQLDTLVILAESVATELALRTARRSAERSEHQALHDPLTGLANRTLFLDRVEHALARADRGEHVAVLFVDLDDFKAINDRLGHAVGDSLLEAVAERLREATRTSDTVARLGGDEFAVLLEAMTAERDASLAATRITAALQRPILLHNTDVQISASIGIAHTRGTETVEELLRHADLAMYRAKHAGKGATAIFEPAMQAAMRERVQLGDDVRQAIDGNELHLLYQPVLDLNSGIMRGMEALARWEHPTRGAVAPNAFIPIAEESTTILSIGRWVLKEACVQLQQWDLEWRTNSTDTATLRRYGPPSIHINISGRHLYDSSLVRDVDYALTLSGITPERVVLEISESAMMQRMDHAVGAFRALKETGVRIAIDDFGTGASSIKYLQQFPIDILKIDRRFVAELGEDGGNMRLARSVVALGDALGLQLIAEGVESAAQRRELRMLGCGSAQGFLFSPPIPAGEITQWGSTKRTHRYSSATPVRATMPLPGSSPPRGGPRGS